MCADWTSYIALREAVSGKHCSLVTLMQIYRESAWLCFVVDSNDSPMREKTILLMTTHFIYRCFLHVASVSQRKYRIRSATRQLTERLRAAAHDRSVALADDTRKVRYSMTSSRAIAPHSLLLLTSASTALVLGFQKPCPDYRRTWIATCPKLLKKKRNMLRSMQKYVRLSENTSWSLDHLSRPNLYSYRKSVRRRKTAGIQLRLPPDTRRFPVGQSVGFSVYVFAGVCDNYSNN